jgi:PAS domain S-box-containing protein
LQAIRYNPLMIKPSAISRFSSQWTLGLPLFSLVLIVLGAVGATAVMLVQQAEQEWALPLLLLLVFALLALTGWSMFALRRHINQRVQAEQERDQFFKLSLDMLGVVDFDGTIRQLNPAVERVLGFKPSDVIGTYFFDYVHKDDVGPTLKAVTDKLLNGEPITYYENRFRTRNGDFKWLSWTANPNIHERQHYIVAHDVTRRKEFEHALGEESAYRKAMEDALSTGMRAIDMDTRITYVNPAFCAMTGFSESELIGTLPPYPYWPDRGYEAHQHNLELTLQGKIDRRGFELMLRRKDGQLISVLFQVSPLVDNHGQQTGWMAAMTDITERQRSNEQLAASHERFVAVLDGLDAAVSVSDLDQNEVLFANGHYRQRYGLDPNQSRFCDSVQYARRRNLPSDASVELDLQERHDQHWLHLRDRPIKWVDGRTVRMEIATDITERIQGEEMYRQQLEKLQTTSRLITMGEMASSLAHELNQPLAAISNYCNGCVARIEAGTTTPQELLGVMQKASTQAERAGTIIRRIREFVKKSEPDRTTCPVSDIIDATIGFADIDARKNGVQLQLDIAADLPPVVADRIMIEQVLLNLLRNAIEAMHDTPMAQRQLLLQVRSTVKGQLQVSVIDRGHGITPQVQEKLFAPFFTTKPHGMGMGLNICRSIIEFHHGQLWVEPNPEGGSVFRFTLPLAN